MGDCWAANSWAANSWAENSWITGAVASLVRELMHIIVGLNQMGSQGPSMGSM